MTKHVDEQPQQPALNLVSPQANSTNYEECLACQ
jgi:hypothetical protein